MTSSHLHQTYTIVIETFTNLRCFVHYSPNTDKQPGGQAIQ